MAARVEEATARRVSVLPLQSPRMREWLGRESDADRGFEPTLVAVDDDGHAVRSWTGRGIAVALVRVLGPWRALRVATVLSAAEAESDEPKALSRRGLLRSGLTVGLASAVGFVVSPSAWADSLKIRMSGAETDLGLVQVGKEATESILRDHLSAAPDLGLVLSGFALGRPDTPDLASVPSDAFRVVGMDEPASTMARSWDTTHVAAARLGNGQGTFVGIANFATGTYCFSVMSDTGVDGAWSIARRYALDASDPMNPTIRQLAHSRDGELVPVLSAQTAADHRALAASCGPSCCSNGPGGKGKELRGDCVASSTWQCIAGAGSCLTCLASSTWLVGLGCAVLSCPAAVATCCASETVPTCQSCSCGIT